MTEPFSTQLSDEQIERLALLLEELGETQQIIGKILRHGYESCHPDNLDGPTNRELLEDELGDIKAALELMLHERDVTFNSIETAMFDKLKNVKRYLHHQRSEIFDFVSGGEATEND